MASDTSKKGTGTGKPRGGGGQRQEATGLKKDRLSPEQLAALYGYTSRQMNVDPEFKALFDKAWEEDWRDEVGKAKFISAFRDLEWYRTNSDSVRKYLLAATDPTSADFIDLQNEAREYVRKTAMTKGVPLDDARIDELSEDSLMGGWGEPSRAYLLERAIVGSSAAGDYTGQIKATATGLQAMAMANGVTMSENYYQSAAKSVASQASTPDYWENQIREQAASTFPVFAEQIRMGMNVMDIASPYVRTMAETLDLNVNDIKLNDPTIMGALTNYNEQGKPYAMNLGEFKQKLRERPEWMDTDQAQNDITSITSSVMKMFGLRG